MTDMTRSGALRTDRALLVLEDGTVYRGYGYGATGASLGEAVFSTGMTGYQETLTDPSYAGQIVVQTAPHIGNTGVNTTDAESRKIWVAGYVVRDAARVASNWRSERTLDEELIEQGIIGIQGIDTRALTRRLRSSGSMRAGALKLNCWRRCAPPNRWPAVSLLTPFRLIPPTPLSRTSSTGSRPRLQPS